MLPSELLRELHESHQRVKAIADAARELEERLRRVVGTELATWHQLNDEVQKDYDDERAGDWTR